MTANAVTSETDIIITLKTIRDYIRWGASQFAEHQVFLGHGLATHLHESATLVFHALYLPDQLDDCYLDSVLTPAERQRVIGLLNRRIKERKPVAYLTRQASFAGLSFFVDERVLVPRSPIAELIEQGFQPWVDEEQVLNILDLCTGSACIAIACAYAFPQARVDAVDLSADALDVAKINREQHKLSEQLNLLQSDLFNALPPCRYDVIVSNPPYVAIQEWKELPAEYHNEPEMGFTGGDSGLDLVLRILTDAKHFLSAQGILIVEVGSSAQTLQQLFPDIPFYWLDFEHGGDGIFLLTAEQVQQYHQQFKQSI
ncbi:MAG: 50S ribosomal protein L3 N(5)-glutamine methyltransferase [Methylococcales bacterium]|jgi:ribosomal protein L3 glutamine methyltransferase|nr:50S ribosomal protein L3 N(5)-glutamine methyltransferase [Methylococcaceae bacterium]